MHLLLQSSSSDRDVVVAVVAAVVGLALALVVLASSWRIWKKMGDPGWMGLIPVLNYYRLFRRSRPEGPVLWTLLTLVCFVGGIVAMVDLARMFGKGIGYALGLIFLPVVFFPLLAFGSATYQGPAIR